MSGIKLVAISSTGATEMCLSSRHFAHPYLWRNNRRLIIDPLTKATFFLSKRGGEGGGGGSGLLATRSQVDITEINYRRTAHFNASIAPFIYVCCSQLLISDSRIRYLIPRMTHMRTQFCRQQGRVRERYFHGFEREHNKLQKRAI